MFRAGPTSQWNGAIIVNFMPFLSALLIDGKGDPSADAVVAEILKYAPNQDVVKADLSRVLEGTAEELKNNENVRQLYLGATAASESGVGRYRKKRRWNR